MRKKTNIPPLIWASAHMLAAWKSGCLKFISPSLMLFTTSTRSCSSSLGNASMRTWLNHANFSWPWTARRKRALSWLNRRIYILFRSDMQFMSNYTSAAASRQPNGETRWKKRKREEKNRRICGCRISYEPAPITWGPTILCRWTPKPTKRRRNNNHKREINWRRSVLWRTAGFVTTCLSLWRVELEKGESNNDGVTVVSRHASGGPCEL